jgi:DNA-directed RNA polymerase beta subunit
LQGASVGIVKNMSLTMQITCNSDSRGVRSFISHTAMLSDPPGTRVFVNGDIVGTTTRPAELYAGLKNAKRSGEIHVYTAVCYDTKNSSIEINTEVCIGFFIFQ